MRPLIYVAGPITSDPWGCVRKAVSVGMVVRRAGAIPFLPQLSVLHQMIEPLSHDEWLDTDLAMLTKCDGLIRLPGESVGASREVDEARTIGMPVFLATDIETIADPLTKWINRPLVESRQ